MCALIFYLLDLLSKMTHVVGAEALPSVEEMREYVAQEKHLSFEQQERRKAKSKFKSGRPGDKFSESVSIILRLPGISAFLLVGLAKKGTVGPDFQASLPWLTDKLFFSQKLIYFIIIIYKCHKLEIKLLLIRSIYMF